MADPKKVAPVVEWFAGEIKAKLAEPQNVEKPHWREMSDCFALDMLEAEVAELNDAARYETDEAIISECCDVAAFAMFIADNARRRMK